MIDPPSPQKERAAQVPGTRGTDSEKHIPARKSPWRREWLPTPVFLPGESCGQRSGRAAVSLWGRKGSDMTEPPTE